MNAPGNNQSFTDRLYQSAAPIWKKCMEHPFVKGIGDGSLPLEKFRYFMLQDYVYLYDYARRVLNSKASGGRNPYQSSRLFFSSKNFSGTAPIQHFQIQQRGLKPACSNGFWPLVHSSTV